MNIKFLLSVLFFSLICPLLAIFSDAQIAKLDRLVNSKIEQVKREKTSYGKRHLLNSFIEQYTNQPIRYSSSSRHRRTDPLLEEKQAYIAAKLTLFKESELEQFIEDEERKALTTKARIEAREEENERAIISTARHTESFPLSLTELRLLVAHLEKQVNETAQAIWNAQANPRSVIALQRKKRELVEQLLKPLKELDTWEKHAKASLSYLQ